MKKLIVISFVVLSGSAQAQSFLPSSFQGAGTGCPVASFLAVASPTPSGLRVDFSSLGASNGGTVFCNNGVQVELPGGVISHLRLHRTLTFEAAGPAVAGRIAQTGTFAGLPLSRIDANPALGGTIQRADPLVVNRCHSAEPVRLSLRTAVRASPLRTLALTRMEFRLQRVLVVPCGH